MTSIIATTSHHGRRVAGRGSRLAGGGVERVVSAGSARRFGRSSLDLFDARRFAMRPAL
jgi:hypothetical protein